MLKTMEELRTANRERGDYYFSPDTMTFFDSRIESPLHKGRFFVMSNREHPARLALSMPEVLILIGIDPIDVVNSTTPVRFLYIAETDATGRIQSRNPDWTFKTRVEALDKLKVLPT